MQASEPMIPTCMQVLMGEQPRQAFALKGLKRIPFACRPKGGENAIIRTLRDIPRVSLLPHSFITNRIS
jgi:hypothetical protein